MEEETKELVDIQKPKKKNVLWIVLSVLFGVLTFAVLAFFIADVVLNVNYFVVEVSGISMERTLQNGDYLYAKKEFEIERGEIAIIDVKNHREVFNMETEFIIKRIIAVEGDSIKLEENIVPYEDENGNPLDRDGEIVDEEKGEKGVWVVVTEVSIAYSGATDYTMINEDYVYINKNKQIFYDDLSQWSKKEAEVWTVGEGQIFFMGDNRTDSYDSRRVGCFETADVVGVVPQWSVDVKRLTTGWERFRSALRGQDAPSKGQ